MRRLATASARPLMIRCSFKRPVIETPEELGLARAPIDERGENGDDPRTIDDAASDDRTRPNDRTRLQGGCKRPSVAKLREDSERFRGLVRARAIPSVR